MKSIFDPGTIEKNLREMRAKREDDPYSYSSLKRWFDLDNWNDREALCLLCDIDPESAEIDWYSGAKLGTDELYKPVIKNAQILSESQTFLKLPRHQAAIEPDDPNFSERVNHKNNQLASATVKLQRIYAIHNRASDRPGLFGSATPKEFVEWALKRNIDIPWLEWADKKNLLKAPKTETPVVIDAPRRVTPSDKRCEEGLRAAITILRQEHASGKLRDWQDFQKCMRKSVVIKYIRENPTDFPHCAKIKPILDMNEGRSIKDREPTLTKSFPDFTKIAEILDEYERLTRKK